MLISPNYQDNPNSKMHDQHSLPQKEFSTKWDQSKSEDYKSHFNLVDIDSVFKKLDNLHGTTINQSVMDELCDEICNLFISPALDVGVTKTCSNTIHVNKPKRESKKPWFNIFCLNKRNEYYKVRNRLKKIKHSNLSQVDDSSRNIKFEFKKYKKIHKIYQRNYYQKFHNNLRQLNYYFLLLLMVYWNNALAAKSWIKTSFTYQKTLQSISQLLQQKNNYI